MKRERELKWKGERVREEERKIKRDKGGIVGKRDIGSVSGWGERDNDR